MKIDVEKMISLARFEDVEIGQVFTTPTYKDFFMKITTCDYRFPRSAYYGPGIFAVNLSTGVCKSFDSYDAVIILYDTELKIKSITLGDEKC